MNIILLIVIILAILWLIFHISQAGKKKETEKKNQEEMRHQSNEAIMRPERKLHEAEKKRWEDAYWKRK